MISPMLANPIDFDKIETKCAGYWMELKLDGVRCIVEKRGDQVQMYTRTGHDLAAKLPHLVTEFQSYGEDFILDGEIGYLISDIYQIFDFNRTMRVVGSGIDEALGKQYGMSDDIQFVAFDLLWSNLEGGISSLTNYHRYFRLKEFAAGWFEDSIYVDRVMRSPAWDYDSYVDYCDAGGEGVILKNPNAFYHEGKRPANVWYKVKKFDTVDVVITGAIEGQGKYTGQIGALTFRSPQGFEGKCSGMDDFTRAAFTEGLQNLIGKHMEVRYFGYVGADKSGLRHPNFVRLRPDLDI